MNKMCGSGMQAAILAADALAAGSADLLVAGGMESMSNAPYLSKKHRAGARIGHDRAVRHASACQDFLRQALSAPGVHKHIGFRIGHDRHFLLVGHAQRGG